MKITINDNWYIEQDQYNYILTFDKEGDINPTTGKPSHTINRWYYSTLQQALLACLGKGAVQEGDFSIQSVEILYDKIAQFKEEILAACKMILDSYTKKKSSEEPSDSLQS